MSEENSFAAFEQQAGGEETPAEVVDTPEIEEEQEEAEEAPAEPAEGEEEEEAPAEAPKPKQSAQERIDEITRKSKERVREIEREAKYWRDVAEGRVKPQSQQDREPVEAKAPNPDNFDLGETDPLFLKAIVAHEVKMGLDEAKKDMAQDLHVQASERVWEARQDAARSKHADYDEKVTEGASKNLWPCSPHMAEAIRTSDVGAELAYHLASNPEEARRLVALDPFSQVRALGRIEASLEAKAPPAPARTTNAPKPPESQARGAGGHFAPNAATTDFAQFEAMANRKS